MTVAIQVRERVGFHRDVYRSLVKVLIQQRKTGELCDVALRFGKHVYTAHRAVLAASSPYFKTMFAVEMMEHFNKEVDLTKSLQLNSADSFKQILDFMYCGDLEINIDNSDDILRIADFLLLDDVKDYCSQFFLQHGNLNLSNALWLNTLASHHNLTTVAERSRAIIRSRFHDYYAHSSELLELPIQIFADLLSDTELIQFTSSRSLTSAIIRWVRYNSSTEEQEQVLRMLLDSANIPQSVSEECSRAVKLSPHSSFYSDITKNRIKDLTYSNCCSCDSSMEGESMFVDNYNLPNEKQETVLFAMNCNTAMKYLRLYLYRITTDQWYSFPIHADTFLRVIPSRLAVCSLMLHDSHLYMYLGFDLPYPTDLQRLHIAVFDVILGRLVLLTFHHRGNAEARLRQTASVNDRTVPPALVSCGGFLVFVGNVDGLGHLFICNPASLTYECVRIPGARFVSLARLVVREGPSGAPDTLFVWCRHRFGHEGYSIDRSVSFLAFSLGNGSVQAVLEYPSPGHIGYTEFSQAHVCCLEEGRVVVHVAARNSLVLDELKQIWLTSSEGMSALPNTEDITSTTSISAPLEETQYRGHSLITHTSDSSLFYLTNPSQYITQLYRPAVGRAAACGQHLTPPPVDGISLMTAGALPSAIFTSLPIAERFDESFDRLIHKKTKHLYDSTDTDGEGMERGEKPRGDSAGLNEEDGYEYDEDIYGYFDDFEYGRGIDDLEF